MSSDETQIRALIDAWHVATRAGDTDTVLGLMTDDVVFLAAGRQPMGKTEFAALSRASAGAPRPSIESRVDIHEVQVSGDLACVWSTISVAVTPPGADHPIERAGHALTVFRREGSRWLLARDANLLAPVRSGRD